MHRVEGLPENGLANSNPIWLSSSPPYSTGCGKKCPALQSSVIISPGLKTQSPCWPVPCPEFQPWQDNSNKPDKHTNGQDGHSQETLMHPSVLHVPPGENVKRDSPKTLQSEKICQTPTSPTLSGPNRYALIYPQGHTENLGCKSVNTLYDKDW